MFREVNVRVLPVMQHWSGFPIMVSRLYEYRLKGSAENPPGFVKSVLCTCSVLEESLHSRFLALTEALQLPFSLSELIDK